jgi:hypothetical protein
MTAFNRAFVSLIAIGWCALLAAGLLLVWEPSRVVDVDGSDLRLAFDIFTETRAEQILATIIIGGLMALGLGLLAFEIMPHRAGHTVDRSASDAHYRELQGRMEEMQKRLNEQRHAAIERSPHPTETISTTEPPRRRWRFLSGTRH